MNGDNGMFRLGHVSYLMWLAISLLWNVVVGE